MTFVRLAFFPGASARQFDVLTERLSSAPAPPARLLFAAGPVDGGWQVVQVWTSREELAAYNRAHFLPALEALGDDGFPAPPVVTDLEPVLLSGPVADRSRG